MAERETALIAENYLAPHRRHRRSWTLETDIRLRVEMF
jgi:hypothetical protein